MADENEPESHKMIKEMGGVVHFREIGSNTSMWVGGRAEETIFFITNFPERGTRMSAVTPEAVAEFVSYWKHQIAVAKGYSANGCNPNVHEWKTPELDEPAPIDVMLFCPKCGHQHIDAPDPDVGWGNPPHKSHLCHACDTVWRPADVPTNGVLSPKTRGTNDTYPGDEGGPVDPRTGDGVN